MLARSAALRRLLASRLETRRALSTRFNRTIHTAVGMADVPSDLPSANECENASNKAEGKAEPTGTLVSEKSKLDTKEEKLPKLSAHEFRLYNRMADHMNYYHNNFRHTWKTLYSACEANKRPAHMSIRQFINAGIQLCQHLNTHHDIEEMHIFPVLARKMPAFQHEMEMETAHKTIHDGLEKMEPWLEACRSGERELNLQELKGIMDGFGTVLWQHLDEEVEELGAENMRKYWSVAEMQRMPM